MLEERGFNGQWEEERQVAGGEMKGNKTYVHVRVRGRWEPPSSSWNWELNFFGNFLVRGTRGG